jgi:ATP-binding cassette subfamily B (MDR/TAP) protein 1
VKEKPQSVFKILATHIPRLPSKTLLILGIIASIGHGVCTPFWSNYLSTLMNIVGQGGTDPSLTKNALIVLGLAIAQGLSDLIQDWTLFALAAEWTAQLRLQTFAKVISQDKSFFDDSANAPSALMQIIIKDIDDMRNLVAQVIGKFIVFVVMVGMGLIWAMIVQWRMTLIGLAVAPFLAVVVLMNELLVGRAEVRNKTKREAVAKTFYEVCLLHVGGGI